MKLKLLVFLTTVSIGMVQCRLEQKYLWKELKYSWPSPEAEQAGISSGQYKPENNLPLGIEVWRNKLFVTVPR